MVVLVRPAELPAHIERDLLLQRRYLLDRRGRIDLEFAARRLLARFVDDDAFVLRLTQETLMRPSALDHGAISIEHEHFVDDVIAAALDVSLGNE